MKFRWDTRNKCRGSVRTQRGVIHFLINTLGLIEYIFTLFIFSFLLNIYKILFCVLRYGRWRYAPKSYIRQKKSIDEEEKVVSPDENLTQWRILLQAKLLSQPWRQLLTLPNNPKRERRTCLKDSQRESPTINEIKLELISEKRFRGGENFATGWASNWIHSSQFSSSTGKLTDKLQTSFTCSIESYCSGL